MEAKASVADLVKRLHSNIDSIHQTIQSLSDTTSHDAELDRLAQERETKVRDLRKEHEDAVKALRIQREKEAQDLAESRRNEEEELEKERQREYEEMMARRAREDAERKRRFEEQQRELDRAKEEEEQRKNREQEMQEKNIQDTIEAELEKLEDEMERKVEEGKKTLRELDENRKAINAQIEEALYAPSMIPNLNFRSRAKTTGQSSINNGKGWWETSKERSYTVSSTEKLISQPKSKVIEWGESSRAFLTNEIKEKEDPIREDTSVAENNGIDLAHIAETNSQTHLTGFGRSEPQNDVHAQAYTAELKADHPNDQEPEPRSLSQLSVHQTTVSEDQLGIDQPISDILQIHSILLDSHKLPDEKIEDLKTESAEAQNKTFPEKAAIIEQKAKLPNASESVHDAKTYPVDNAEEKKDASVKDTEVGNPIVERDIEQSAEVDVRGSKILASELPDSTSPRSDTNVANGITLERGMEGSSSSKETRETAVSLAENESVREPSSSVAQYDETEQLDLPTSTDTNRSEIYDPHRSTQEDKKYVTSSDQRPSSTEDPANPDIKVPAYSDSGNFNDFLAQEEPLMKNNLPALSEQTRELPPTAKGNEVHQLGLMSIQLSPKISQPRTEESSSPSEQPNLEMDFLSREKQPEESIKSEEIPLPTPTPDAEKNLQLNSALVPADTVQRLEQDFVIQDQLSLQELDSKTADLPNGYANDTSREHLGESPETDLEKLEMVQDHDANRNLSMSSLNNPEERPIAHAVEEEPPEATTCHHQSQQPISEQSQPLLKEHERQSKSEFDAITNSASIVIDSETPSHEPAEMIRVEQSGSSGLPRMQYHRKINRDLAAMHGYNSGASGDESDIQDDVALKVALRPAISEKEVSVVDAKNRNIKALADIEKSDLTVSSPVEHNASEEDTSLNRHSFNEMTSNNFSFQSIDQANTHSNPPEDESPSDGLPHDDDVQLSQILDGGDLSTTGHGLAVDTSRRNFIESNSSPSSGGTKSGRTTPEKPILKTDPLYQKDENTPTKRVQFKDLDPLDTNTKSIYLPPDFDVMDHDGHSSQPEGVKSNVPKPQSDMATSKTHGSDTESHSHTPTKEAHVSPTVSENKVQPQSLVYDHQEVSNQLSEHHKVEYKVESPITGANSDDLFESDEEDEEEEDQRTPQPNKNGSFPLSTNPAPRTPTQEASQQAYSADSPVQSSPIQSRWAQLRKNAVERAAASRTAEQMLKDELEIKAPVEGDFNNYASKETIRSPNPKSERSTSDETEDFHSLSDYPQLSRTHSEETTQFYESYDQQTELTGQRSRSATTDTVPSYVHSDYHSTPSSPSEAPSSPFQELPGNEPAISSSWQSPGRSLDLPEEPRDFKTQVLPVSGDFDPFNPQSYPSYATKKTTDILVKSQDGQDIIPSTENSNQAQPGPLSRLITENSSPVLTTRDSPRSATPTNIKSPTRIPRRSVNSRRASTAPPINPATTSFFQKTRQLFESPGATAHQISHARTSSPRPLSGLFYSSSTSSSPSTKSQSGFYNAKPPVSPYDESRDGEEPELIPRSLDRDGRAPSPVYTLPAPPPPPKDKDLRRNSQSPRGSFLGGLGRWAGSGGLEESVYNPNRKVPEGQPLLGSGGARLSGGVRVGRERRGSGYEGEGYGDGNRN